MLMGVHGTRLQLLVQGQHIHKDTVLETLGACFSVGVRGRGCGTGTPDRWAEVQDRFLTTLGRLKEVPVAWDKRAADVGALMGGITYSAVAWDAERLRSELKQRYVVDAIAGGRANTRRCQEVALSLRAPVHRVAAPEAIVHEQLATLIPSVNRDEVQQIVREHYWTCAGAGPRPVASITHSVRPWPNLDGSGAIGTWFGTTAAGSGRSCVGPRSKSAGMAGGCFCGGVPHPTGNQRCCCKHGGSWMRCGQPANSPSASAVRPCCML